MILHRQIICALLALVISTAPGILRAGTTGVLSGTVADVGTGAPIANAAVSATSASQSASIQSDASGHFTFISLAPDTYVVSAQKEGYDPVSRPGVSVFADQTHTIVLGMRKTLKTIASVRSQAASALVKPGTTSDIYSVDENTARQTAVLGGGGNLNNAYSAIASVPGTYVPQGQQGYGQSLYIRGGDYDQIGYEYDGVPVNRSFDNYAGGSLSSLGQQELQVYTGGATPGVSSAAISGFINQVIKTGTYPGYGTLSAQVGSPTFYHQFMAEVGGATPNRSFSYYAGVSGYNQNFRLFDQYNGGGTHPELGYASVLNDPENNSANGLATGVVPNCVAGTSGFGTTYHPEGAFDPGCYGFGPGFVAMGANVLASAGPGSGGFFFAQEIDREAVANLHFAIPHKNDTNRDDVQILFSSGTLWSPIEDSQNDIGLQTVYNAIGPPFMHPECVVNGALVCNSALSYDDPNVWSYAFGTPVTASTHATPYLQPGSPQNRAQFALVDPNARDAYENDQNIWKVQYQHNFGSSAYLRAYGYTLYSDWLINGPNNNATLIPTGILPFGNIGPTYGASPDYELSTHTRGAELQFADQLSAKNLLTFTANYTTANTIRANNTTYVDIAGSNARATSDTDGTNCFNSTGAVDFCNSKATAGTYDNPMPFAAVNGSWIVTNNAPRATFNTVTPKFYSVALANEYKPNDKWLITIGSRFERFEYGLSDTSGNGRNFWFAAAQREFCYDPATLAASITPAVTCPGTMVHPDGLNGHRLLTNNYDHTVVNNVFSPRLASTYTINPDTVLRMSYGRYAEPVKSAFVQYNREEPNTAKFLFQTFWKYGYTSPRHDVLPVLSDQADLSLEKRLHGTDVSFKITPYYRSTEHQVQQFYLDPTTGFVSGLNVGHEIAYGVEFQMQKGNFDQNGFSGLISYTWNHTRIRYDDFLDAPGRNVIDVLNDSIKHYNSFTAAGGGAQCYTNGGNGTPDPACGPTSIRNPYFNQPEQPLLDRNGQYYPFTLFPSTPQFAVWVPNITDSYFVPNVVTAVLNYRINKLAITPSVTYASGTRYGAPLDTPGIDPSSCTNNSHAIPSAPDPLQADYTSCTAAVSVPNPENGTGHFTSLGQFRNPDQLSVNFGLSYDISPKLRATAIVANVFTKCFGGTATAWTAAWPPGYNICAYGSNGYAPSPIAPHGGFYNGSGPNDVVANGTTLNPYIAHTYQPIGYNMPLEAYFQLQVKL